MATIDKYNNLLDELVSDTKKLAASLSNLQKTNSERTIEIEKILAEAHHLILNTIPEGDLIDVLVIFSELESNISEYNALKSASDFQKSSELTIQESLKLNKEHTIISETLEKTIAGIDDYLASLRRRAKIPRLKPRPIKYARAKDIPSVLFIDSVLSSMNQSFKTLEVDLKSTEKSIRTLIRSFPEPLLNVVKNINQLLIGLNESIEKLREQNILLDETHQKIPKSVTEWLSILNKRLEEREQHLSPNLPLSAGDLRNFSANLFDVELDLKRNTIHLIEQELSQVQLVMKTHFEKVDYNLFDIGSPTKKKKDKLSSKFRNILNQHVQTTVDMKGLNKRKKRFETYEKKICSNFEDMLAQASNSTRAHFKESPFSILLMTALKVKPAKYVDAYKKSWHTYPNYHLCFEFISNSDKSVRKLDRLIKLPISSKLCKACLTDELTQDQAMILQDIDTHNDLYELFNSHNIDLGLVFVLHAQEGRSGSMRYWRTLNSTK